MTTDGVLSITVDMEFFDSAFLFRDRAPDRVPEETRTMGVEGLDFIAQLFEQHGVRGTFFTLGEVAAQMPEKITDLADRGHEIASHGLSKSHPDLRAVDAERVSEELIKSKRILEETTGQRVKGFRAPAFALDDEVMKHVSDAGYTYDSSVVPSRRIPGFYGTPEAPSVPFSSAKLFSTSNITELPIAVSKLLKLPLSGAWTRLLGRQYTLRGVRNHLTNHPATVLYIHPWEFVELPSYEPIPKRVTWRTGGYTRETFSRLVEEHASRIQTMGTIHEQFDSLPTSEPEVSSQ